jgi:hypothetical protein
MHSSRTLSSLLVVVSVGALLFSGCSQSLPSGGELTVRSNTITVDPTSKAPARATCNNGEQMVGGGYTLSHPSSPLSAHIMESYPDTDISWTVWARTTSEPVQLTVYVYCYRGPLNLQITRRSSIDAVPPTPPPPPTEISGTGASGVATAHCDPSALATSGGFYFSPHGGPAVNNLDPDGWVDSSQPNGSDWGISGHAYPEDGVTPPNVDLVAWAVCVGAHAVAHDYPTAGATVSGTSVTEAAVLHTQCSSSTGTTLINGGYKLGIGPTGRGNVLTDGGDSFDKWPVDVQTPSPPLDLFVIGVCVKFA